MRVYIISISQGKSSVDGEDEMGAASTQQTKGKRKPAYAGGLVLEPKKGEYM